MTFPGSTVGCPRCGAELGARCFGADPLSSMPHAHRNRVAREAQAAIECADCSVQPGQPCLGTNGPRGLAHKNRTDSYLESWPAHSPSQSTAPPAAPVEANRVIHGDCLAVMAEMPDASVDLIITSPPYNALNTPGGGWWDKTGKYYRRRSDQPGNDAPLYDRHDDAMPVDDYIQWQRDCVSEMLRLLTDDGALFYNHRRRVQEDIMEEHARDILEIAPAFGFHVRQIIDWARSGGFNHNPGYLLPCQEQIYLLAKPTKFRHRALGTVAALMQVPQVAAPKGISLPPQFPVEIPRALLAAIRPDVRRKGCHGIVLDPFGGSGTVAEAAVLEGWDYVYIDISETYCAYARERVARASDDTQLDDTQLDDTQLDDTQLDDTQLDDTQLGWDSVPPEWTATDKAVYDYIAALQQSQGGPEAVAITQSDIVAALSRSLRTINASIGKLQKHGSVSVRRQGRSASWYSATHDVPRWPVKVAGGLGTHDTQHDTQLYDAQSPGTRDSGTGLLNQSLDTDLNPGTRYRSPGASANDTQLDDTQLRCPIHRNPRLQRRTRFKNLVAITQATGDEIRYCYGSGGKCSWVHSRELGTVVAAGGGRLDALGIEAAYYDVRSVAKPTAGSDQDTSRTGYIDQVRDLYGGRLPWETTEEAAN